jgi:hypothetical protein
VAGTALGLVCLAGCCAGCTVGGLGRTRLPVRPCACGAWYVISGATRFVGRTFSFASLPDTIWSITVPRSCLCARSGSDG